MSTEPLSERDYELISSYLDGEISGRQKQTVELRLTQDARYKLAYEQLSQVRSLLRSQPLLRSPRSYTLSPNVISVSQPSPKPLSLLPSMVRAASAFASVFFLVLFVWNLVSWERSGLFALEGREVFSQAAPAEVAPMQPYPYEATQSEQPPMSKGGPLFPTPSELYPPPEGIGEMGGGGGSGAPGGFEAPLLAPYPGTLLAAPTATVPPDQTALATPVDEHGRVEQINSSNIPFSEGQARAETEEATAQASRRAWALRQLVYGVLAVSFALLALRSGKRRT
ncbi:MAG: hypothetical protein NZ840_00900 [Anaerolineales bacterium]|nr:hypothetical protein [Anaerolineales bacterium]MDW8160594.1 hypothetical protein [Anaerolineales bacterium]